MEDTKIVKSVCFCGHSGGADNSEHEDNGLGECTHVECKCRKFHRNPVRTYCGD